jgi:hypothetical protein
VTDERTKQDWANYRRFVHHKNALNMIFNFRPQLLEPDADTVPGLAVSDRKAGRGQRSYNADVQYDVERAADEEGVSVADYLKGPTSEY